MRQDINTRMRRVATGIRNSERELEKAKGKSKGKRKGKGKGKAIRLEDINKHNGGGVGRRRNETKVNVAVEGEESKWRRCSELRVLQDDNGNRADVLLSRWKNNVYTLEEVLRISILKVSFSLCLRKFVNHRIDGFYHDGGRTVDKLRKFYGLSGDGVGERNRLQFDDVFFRRADIVSMKLFSSSGVFVCTEYLFICIARAMWSIDLFYV